MTTAKSDFIVSMEGIGSSGKTTQISMLAEALRSKYNVTSHKVINRDLLEGMLKPLSSGQAETIWVANLPDVEIGADLLAFLALYMQRYSVIKEEVGGRPHIFLIERYLYSPFMHVAARVVLSEIEKAMKSGSSAPGRLANQIQKESTAKGVPFESLVRMYKDIGMKMAGKRIDALYRAFTGASSIVAWPNLVFVLDVPVKAIKPREVKRENRAYTLGDILYYEIVADLYKRIAKREPKRIYLIDGTAAPELIAESILRIVKRRCNLETYKR